MSSCIIQGWFDEPSTVSDEELEYKRLLKESENAHFYYGKAALILLVADHMVLPSNSGQQAYRDAVRMYGLKCLDYYTTTIDQHSPTIVFKNVHCNSTVNDVRRLQENLKIDIPEHSPVNDFIAMDYCRVSSKIINYIFLIFEYQ